MSCFNAALVCSTASLLNQLSLSPIAIEYGTLYVLTASMIISGVFRLYGCPRNCTSISFSLPPSTADSLQRFVLAHPPQQNPTTPNLAPGGSSALTARENGRIFLG